MSTEPRYEKGDAEPKSILTQGVVFVAIIASAFGLMVWLLGFLGASVRSGYGEPSPLAKRQLPAAPRLQTAPGEELATFRARERALLGSYGWVDRELGRVHIPIERALELVHERRALPSF